MKGWLQPDGTTAEKVFDVVWSGDRSPGTKGKVPSVGNSVNVEDGTWDNSIGSAELKAVWTDPEFDPGLEAFYYVRVIEIPTPSWVAYDIKTLGTELPEGATDDVLSVQDRAYTSPIWYTPK